MPGEYHCLTCNETFREETPEAVLKRAAAHNHSHHGGPESLTPELEAALRGEIRQASAWTQSLQGPRLHCGPWGHGFRDAPGRFRPPRRP